MNLQSNPQLELAFEYVRNTKTSLFLTGKAGSGKTTFLHQIKAEGSKRLVVVAPTGVAAINAGGMTIHSFFQLPFGLHLPGVPRKEEHRQRRFRGEKIRLIRSLELLVIDEISMVRADLLDAIDEVLRRYRNLSQPFGGVQLLMIGDLHQLPPVVKQDEWEMLSRYYDTPYFFDSRALHQTEHVSIELKHIYRQSDPDFIELLNKVRDNRCDEESLRKLNSRYIANFQPPAKDAYITLTATNAVAHDINAGNLDRLPGAPHRYQASVVGEFPPSSYPTEETLDFKSGAQVMFIKNDLDPEKRYYNGKIGTITRCEPQAIHVRCPGDPAEIVVTPVDWQNVKYSLNEETKEIDEEVVGTFTQYPLKLAWAITIHKSQGLTFERAIIDAQAAFAFGQVYVALSRCKSFEGIVLRSKINTSSVKTDPVVRNFSAEAERNAPQESHLWQAKRAFQADVLRELFSFDSIHDEMGSLCSTLLEHSPSLPPDSLPQVQALARRAKAELADVAAKFAPQLAGYLSQEAMPDANSALQGRLQRAAVYFTERIDGLIRELLALPMSTVQQTVAASIASHVRAIELACSVKHACFSVCRSGFTTEAYCRAKVHAELEFARKTVTSIAPKKRSVRSDLPHPVLYRQLLDWREQAAQRNNIPARDVLPDVTVAEIVTYLPMDVAGLRQILGIGKGRQRRYGQEICDLVTKYREEQKLMREGTPVKPLSPPRTSETKRLSFELFRAGKSLDQIAAERQLTRGTIEGHLSHFISLGELDVYSVVDRQTVGDIQQFLLAQPEAGVAEAKAHFGDNYRYGELKMVVCHVQRIRGE